MLDVPMFFKIAMSYLDTGPSDTYLDLRETVR